MVDFLTTEQKQLFLDKTIFDYINWLSQYDSIQQFGGDLSQIQGTFSTFEESILIENLSKVENYFSLVLDQPIYMSEDYQNFRKFLIYWYASFKTLMDRQKYVSSIEAINKELMLESLGYTLSYLTNDTVNQQILLNLSNMYDIKGTPLVIQQIFTILGFQNFNLFEYWLYNEGGQLKFVPFPVNDTGFNTSLSDLFLLSKDYENTDVVNDPHWYYTSDEILQLDSVNNNFTLPSLTPYVGLIMTNDWVRNSKLVLSLISRYITDQYDKLVNDGVYPERMYYSKLLDTNLSLLETVMLLSYVYNNYFNRVSVESRQGLNLFIAHFNGSENVKTSDIQFINEFDRVHRRASNRKEKEQLIEEARLKFQIDDKEVVWTYLECAQFLVRHYPDVKEKADIQLQNDQGLLLISELLDILNYFIKIEKGILTFDFQYVLRDFLMDDKTSLLEIFDFFKPWQARLLELANYFMINDLPGDQFFIDSVLDKSIIQQLLVDLYVLYKDECITLPLIKEKEYYIIRDNFDYKLSVIKKEYFSILDETKDILKNLFVDYNLLLLNDKMIFKLDKQHKDTYFINDIGDIKCFIDNKEYNYYTKDIDKNKNRILFVENNVYNIFDEVEIIVN